MIEINLLPEEMRRTESTPPVRMLAIVASIVCACAMVFFVVRYHTVDMPKIAAEIATADSDIKNYNDKKARVTQLQTDIETLKSKLNTLENLQQSRIRYARLLDRLCDANPDGVWFRTFNVVPEVAGVVSGSAGTGGKRYQVALTGYTTGATDQEMDEKLVVLLNNIRSQFSVLKEDTITPVTAPLDFGFDKFISAKFDSPISPRRILVNEMPLPTNLDIKSKKNVEIYKRGLDFILNVSFEMPAPKT
jgi:Tfp pilus assembly protein PilN